jgi:hypothetical protein
MKVYMAVLVGFQIGELAIYLSIFRHINNHSKEMLRASVITNDIYQVSPCLR